MIVNEPAQVVVRLEEAMFFFPAQGEEVHENTAVEAGFWVPTAKS